MGAERWVGGGRDKVKRFGGRQGQVARGWPSMGVRLGFSLGFEGLGFGVWPFKVS